MGPVEERENQVLLQSDSMRSLDCLCGSASHEDCMTFTVDCKDLASGQKRAVKIFFRNLCLATQCLVCVGVGASVYGIIHFKMVDTTAQGICAALLATSIALTCLKFCLCAFCCAAIPKKPAVAPGVVLPNQIV